MLQYTQINTKGFNMIKIIKIDETVAVNIDEPKFDKAFQCMIKNIGGDLVDISYNVGYMSNISDIVKINNSVIEAFNIDFSIHFREFGYSMGRKFNFSSLKVKTVDDYKIEVKDRVNTIYSILSNIVHKLNESREDSEDFNPFTLY